MYIVETRTISGITQSLEVKHNNRFFVKFPKEFNIAVWQIQKINKPKYADSKWMNIEIFFLDTIELSISKSLFNLIILIQTQKTNNQTKPLFIFDIVNCDQKGEEIETWEIGVDDITYIDFGNCDYSSDDIQQIKMIIKPLFCLLK